MGEGLEDERQMIGSFSVDIEMDNVRLVPTRVHPNVDHFLS